MLTFKEIVIYKLTILKNHLNFKIKKFVLIRRQKNQKYLKQRVHWLLPMSQKVQAILIILSYLQMDQFF